MSNIPDITSLSDLLTTSPNQPNVPGSNSNHSDQGTSLRLDLATKINGEPAADTTQEESAEDKSMENMKALLEHQSVKLSLVGERNELLRQRANLISSVDDLRVKLKYFQDLKQKQSTEKKLQDLLTENARDIVAKTQAQSLANTNDDDEILDNLNVLPSSNWNDRLQLIRKFSPYIDLENISSTNHIDENDRLVRVIEYLVVSPLLFKMPLRLCIDARTESIFDIQLPEKASSVNKFKKKRSVSPSMVTLTILSKSFSRVCINDYLPTHKIDLIMYGLSSLSKLLHRRVSIMYKLIRKFASQLTGTQRLSSLLEEKDTTDNVKLFAILKSLDTITFSVRKGDENYEVRLRWDIIVNDETTGECESELSLGVFNGDGESVFPKINEMFTKLAQDYGVINGLTFLMEETFELHSRN